MPGDESRRVRELPQMATPALRNLWQELFARAPHPKIRREVMIAILAYKIQEEAYGGLKPETVRRLRKLAQEYDRNPAAASISNRIKPGTRIIRQWGADTHEVTVTRDGYSYR